jgi:hypothetical protein
MAALPDSPSDKKGGLQDKVTDRKNEKVKTERVNSHKHIRLGRGNPRVRIGQPSPLPLKPLPLQQG